MAGEGGEESLRKPARGRRPSSRSERRSRQEDRNSREESQPETAKAEGEARVARTSASDRGRKNDIDGGGTQHEDTIETFDVRNNPLADVVSGEDQRESTQWRADAANLDTSTSEPGIKHEVLQRLRSLSIDVGETPASSGQPDASLTDASSPEVKRLLIAKLRSSTSLEAAIGAQIHGAIEVREAYSHTRSAHIHSLPSRYSGSRSSVNPRPHTACMRRAEPRRWQSS